MVHGRTLLCECLVTELVQNSLNILKAIFQVVNNGLQFFDDSVNSRIFIQNLLAIESDG